ncbi:hypothetical protein GCM10023259_035170 [Thermocatellispora tengchongensis]
MDHFDAEYFDLDRRESRIQRHILAAFWLGLLFGLLGTLIRYSGPEPLHMVVDPYAYLLLGASVGATAYGVGWAMLSSLLAAVSPLVSGLACAALIEGFKHDGWISGGFQLNFVVVLSLAYGLLAYGARRDGYLGDAAAGLLGGAMIADAAEKALPGFEEYLPGFAPWPLAVVSALAVGLVLFLRRTVGARLRALLAALAVPMALILLVPAP